MLKIGWKAGIEQYQPDELLEYAVLAEKSGFDAIDVSDHFHPWSEDGASGFTWLWLGGAFARTSEIEIGTGLTCPILRYHPAIIAQAAATAAYMSGDRFYLGVGTGEALNEYAAMGEWPGYEVRQRMLGEAIDLIRALWTGQEITWDGDFYQTRKARLFTLPKKRIPIYISSLVPSSAYFAGKYGDGLLTVGGKPDKIYKEMLSNFTQGAKQSGKLPNELPKLIEVNAAYTDNKKAVVANMKKYWAGTFIPALFDQKIYTPAMSAENGKVVGNDAVEETMCISTNYEDHVAFLNSYARLGFSDIYVHSPGPNEQDFIKNYGKNVINRLKHSARSQATYVSL